MTYPVKSNSPQVADYSAKYTFPRYLLSDTVGSSTVGFSSSFVSASSTLSVPNSPLRLIVSRTPVSEEFYHSTVEKVVGFIDTLECGHQQIVYNLAVRGFSGTDQKRHRCPECAQSQVEALPPKKPARSVKIPGVLKRAA